MPTTEGRPRSARRPPWRRCRYLRCSAYGRGTPPSATTPDRSMSHPSEWGVSPSQQQASQWYTGFLPLSTAAAPECGAGHAAPASPVESTRAAAVTPRPFQTPCSPWDMAVSHPPGGSSVVTRARRFRRRPQGTAAGGGAMSRPWPGGRAGQEKTLGDGLRPPRRRGLGRPPGRPSIPMPCACRRGVTHTPAVDTRVRPGYTRAHDPAVCGPWWPRHGAPTPSRRPGGLPTGRLRGRLDALERQVHPRTQHPRRAPAAALGAGPRRQPGRPGRPARGRQRAAPRSAWQGLPHGRTSCGGRAAVSLLPLRGAGSHLH
jgi:hypothetical protein